MMNIDKSNQALPRSSDDACFDEIRPARDNEVKDLLAQIYGDKSLVQGILKFKYPQLAHWLHPIIAIYVRYFLKHKLDKITSIDQFQQLVAGFMRKVIANTTDGVEYVGFDKLDPKQGYLFISNHRDISLDPAFVDMALQSVGLDTVRIAIGDNLLKLPAATALMRLNKSFIVKRSISSPRELLKASKLLSAYIGLSVHEGHNVWIAEREGRAKDGNDRADTAVLKMFHLFGRAQKLSFKDYIASLNLVPVAISYEYDPSDLDKAHELRCRAEHDGAYHKGELEDMRSIVGGIKGYKGKVRIVAGSPLRDGFETPEELAALIDAFIFEHYACFAPTLIAAGQGDQCLPADKAKFKARIDAYPEELRSIIMDMYARPYNNLQELKSKSAGSAKI